MSPTGIYGSVYQDPSGGQGNLFSLQSRSMQHQRQASGTNRSIHSLQSLFNGQERDLEYSQARRHPELSVPNSRYSTPFSQPTNLAPDAYGNNDGSMDLDFSEDSYSSRIQPQTPSILGPEFHRHRRPYASDTNVRSLGPGYEYQSVDLLTERLALANERCAMQESHIARLEKTIDTMAKTSPPAPAADVAGAAVPEFAGIPAGMDPLLAIAFVLLKLGPKNKGASPPEVDIDTVTKRWWDSSSEWDRHRKLEADKRRSTKPLGYLTNQSGDCIDEDTMKAMYQTAKGIYIFLYSIYQDPVSWGNRSDVVWEFYKSRMYHSYPFLAWCKNDWKAREFATRSYAEWTRSGRNNCQRNPLIPLPPSSLVAPSRSSKTVKREAPECTETESAAGPSSKLNERPAKRLKESRKAAKVSLPAQNSNAISTSDSEPGKSSPPLPLLTPAKTASAVLLLSQSSDLQTKTNTGISGSFAVANVVASSTTPPSAVESPLSCASSGTPESASIPQLSPSSMQGLLVAALDPLDDDIGMDLDNLDSANGVPASLESREALGTGSVAEQSLEFTRDLEQEKALSLESEQIQDSTTPDIDGSPDKPSTPPAISSSNTAANTEEPKPARSRPRLNPGSGAKVAAIDPSIDIPFNPESLPLAPPPESSSVSTKKLKVTFGSKPATVLAKHKHTPRSLFLADYIEKHGSITNDEFKNVYDKADAATKKLYKEKSDRLKKEGDGAQISVDA